MRVRIARSAQKRRHAVKETGAGRGARLLRPALVDMSELCDNRPDGYHHQRKPLPPAHMRTRTVMHGGTGRWTPTMHQRCGLSNAQNKLPSTSPREQAVRSQSAGAHAASAPSPSLLRVLACLGGSAQMSMGYILRAVALACNRDAAVTRLPAQRRALCPEDCEPREPAEHELG